MKYVIISYTNPDIARNIADITYWADGYWASTVREAAKYDSRQDADKVVSKLLKIGVYATSYGLPERKTTHLTLSVKDNIEFKKKRIPVKADSLVYITNIAEAWYYGYPKEYDTIATKELEDGTLVLVEEHDYPDRYYDKTTNSFVVMKMNNFMQDAKKYIKLNKTKKAAKKEIQD